MEHDTFICIYMQLQIMFCYSYRLSVATEEGGLGCSNTPPPEIPNALQNSAKFNPTVKTAKNCWI